MNAKASQALIEFKKRLKHSSHVPASVNYRAQLTMASIPYCFSILRSCNEKICNERRATISDPGTPPTPVTAEGIQGFRQYFPFFGRSNSFSADPSSSSSTTTSDVLAK
ncbi:unnamed protein product [Didymodactylos carnosus]|uniref:Uncharacterized protein n=1 Tax=Didymodactylos carnosus TaxID=1234261 RepID=A0A815TLF3_9BILA|nr:unnamed protein product [Didymodactylos carnosus]CAF4365902.1 unnamed protein product [Didymodactylos carnosus]